MLFSYSSFRSSRGAWLWSLTGQFRFFYGLSRTRKYSTQCGYDSQPIYCSWLNREKAPSQISALPGS